MITNVDDIAKKAAEEIFYEWQRPQSQHRHVVAILMDAFYRGYWQGRKDQQAEQNAAFEELMASISLKFREPEVSE